jgi:hypothetical protein
VTQTTSDGLDLVSGVTETNELTGTTILLESFAYVAAGNRAR